MIKIETAHLKGISQINEDAYAVNVEESIFAVIDGATGLGGLSGSISSQIIAHALKEEKGGLLERVKKGNEILGKQAVIAYGDEKVKLLNQIPKIERSTCGLAAIELIKDGELGLIKMRYAAAADCIIFLQYKNGKIRQLTYDYMESLDGQALEVEMEQWQDYLAQNENPNHWDDHKVIQVKKDIHERVKSILKQNRNKLNTPEGYGIIDGSKEALEFLETGMIPMIGVEKILLLTDGLKSHSPLYQPLKDDWMHSAELAFTFGLNYLVENILKIEGSDPACYDYPRFKQHDDKTGILITL